MRLPICAALALVAAAQAGEVVSPKGSVGSPGQFHPNGLAQSVWSTTDLKTHAPLPSGEVTVKNVAVKWQIGNYWSDGLRIYGLVCAPAASQVHYPVAILNHGLDRTKTGPNQYIYHAIAARGFTGCTTMAAHGWLTAISTYRGEMIEIKTGGTTIINAGGGPAPVLTPTTFSATSDGKVELCSGEVDDVINLLSAVRALPVANANRVLMWGHSHGSCITERAIERGAPVQVAVSIDGPTDFTKWTFDPLYASTNDVARSTASPVNNPLTLANAKFLRIHAEGDEMVPPDQGCELAAQIPNIAAYYFDSSKFPVEILPNAPAACAGIEVPWKQGGPVPGTNGEPWVSPTFLMYSGHPNKQAHAFILFRSWPKFASFVNAFTKNKGWSAEIPDTFFMIEN